ncbi:MAG: LysR family transcriptional regulator [Pseudomonadota bacterium]
MPPLNAVRVFAVVARRLNFARAADELGVTQSAVSKQIQILEDHIGTKLFERRAQGVDLTVEGRELREAVLPAIDALATGFERYRRRPARSERVRITTTVSFAALALLPNLGAFERDNPDLTLEIAASDRLVDLDDEDIDFAVRFVPIRDLGPDAATAPWLTPTASPELLSQYEDDPDAVLTHARRITTFARDAWAAYSEMRGLAAPSSVRTIALENFAAARTAAAFGLGVALLPSPLIVDDARRNRLTVLGEQLPWDEAFGLLEPRRAVRHPGAGAVKAWLTGLLTA